MELQVVHPGVLVMGGIFSEFCLATEDFLDCQPTKSYCGRFLPKMNELETFVRRKSARARSCLYSYMNDGAAVDRFANGSKGGNTACWHSKMGIVWPFREPAL